MFLGNNFVVETFFSSLKFWNYRDWHQFYSFWHRPSWDSNSQPSKIQVDTLATLPPWLCW